jgi:hypothetical protein
VAHAAFVVNQTFGDEAMRLRTREVAETRDGNIQPLAGAVGNDLQQRVSRRQDEPRVAGR